MANTLSLRTLLDNDKLYGPNFDSWYQKLKIVLEYEWILYVILDPAPEEPASNDHMLFETLIRSGSMIAQQYAAS